MGFLLNSFGEEGYHRFEEALYYCLEKYRDSRNSPYIETNKKSAKGGIVALNDFPLTLEHFLDYYGIFRPHKSSMGIAVETYGVYYYTKTKKMTRWEQRQNEDDRFDVDAKKFNRRIHARKSLVSNRIVFVTELLKQRHKSDIWYQTLG